MNRRGLRSVYIRLIYGFGCDYVDKARQNSDGMDKVLLVVIVQVQTETNVIN